MSENAYCRTCLAPIADCECDCGDIVTAGEAKGVRLARAVLAYDAALTAWGTAAAQHDRTAIQAAKDAMDTAYRTMMDLAREVGG